ncbi:Uncharacterised protein [uncultured archaeon]|nr:Uncharacterised protein [uncultured archaeon]
MTEEITEEPKGLNKPTIIFLIIFIIVFFAIVGVLSVRWKTESPASNVVEYNYFKFEEVGGLWQTNIQLDNQPYEAIFRFNPKQAENVSIKGNFTGFKTTPIYITFDPDVGRDKFKYLALAASELTLNVVKALNYTVEAACTKNETDICSDRPIVTCADDASVIYLVSDAPTQIKLEGDCITLSGENMELLRSVDRLLFQWYKIIK